MAVGRLLPVAVPVSVQRSRRLRVSLAVVVTVLVVVNVWRSSVSGQSDLVLGPLVVVVLVALSRWAGLSWDDLGMSRCSWRRGAGYAVVAVVLVGAVYGAGVALPVTRSAFLDSRYRLEVGRALVTALVVIPVRTVLLEEVAFRGVLLGLLRRHRGGAWASGVSSGLFGLWHVLPGLTLSGTNRAVGAVVGQGDWARLPVVLATVAVTGAAGLVFCELRRRSGSLLASAGLHWATNGLGVLVAAALWAWQPA